MLVPTLEEFIKLCNEDDEDTDFDPKPVQPADNTATRMLDS